MPSSILFFCLVFCLFTSFCNTSLSPVKTPLESTPASSTIQNTSKIKDDLKNQLIADINNNKNNFRLSKENLEILNKHLNHEQKDLNGDGKPEFFVFIDHSDWCGAGSNCSYWVYRKTEAGYELLVEDKVLTVKDTITNGYSDLSSETPIGFCEQNVQRLEVMSYKFDGKKYQAQKPETECRTVRLK